MAHEGLILTGFMGMGKSTIGPVVAERLGISYTDTDEWLETESGIDIPELVRNDMPAFRRAEADALKTILDQEPGVVSTGGGIVSTELGRAVLLSSNIPVIWLKASFEVAANRVLGDSGRERPLFSDLESARILFDDRQALYSMTAHHSVNADQPPAQVVEDIVHRVG